MEPVIYRWSAETLPISTRMVNLRDIRKRSDVRWEKSNRVRVAALTVDLEGWSCGAGVGSKSSRVLVEERCFWRAR